MIKQEQDMWKTAAVNWQIMEQTADNFINANIDAQWWQMKKEQCHKSYTFCMFMASTRTKPAYEQN